VSAAARLRSRACASTRVHRGVMGIRLATFPILESPDSSISFIHLHMQRDICPISADNPQSLLSTLLLCPPAPLCFHLIYNANLNESADVRGRDVRYSERDERDSPLLNEKRTTVARSTVEIQARRDNNAPKNEISRERLKNFTRNNNVASAITSFPSWLSVTRKYRNVLIVRSLVDSFFFSLA